VTLLVPPPMEKPLAHVIVTCMPVKPLSDPDRALLTLAPVQATAGNRLVLADDDKDGRDYSEMT
jgi:hypothetical protein